MTVYLTRFRINPARREARKLLNSPNAMHAAVRAAFASEDPAGRALWRLDTPAPATVHLYLVSRDRPDLTHLVEQAGWPTTETWETRDYTGLLGSLANTQRWAFRLTANPVHSGRREPGAKQTQRFGYLREDEQRQWLVRKAERHGFSVVTQADGQPNLEVHHRHTTTFKRGTGNVTLVRSTFDGLLEITDVEEFRRTLTGGLGHAKAYGCGLLTLAPPG